MSDSNRSFTQRLLGERTELLVAVGVIGVVMMLIIPLPAVILDLLMALNLMLSLIIILIVLYTTRALDFSVFPTLLLVTTVFSLALNVSSTRLILSKGGGIRREDGSGLRYLRCGLLRIRGSGYRAYHLYNYHSRSVYRHHQRRHPSGRGGGEIYPGLPSGKADGHRSGVQLRGDHRRRGNQEEKRSSAGGPDFYGAMDGASKFVSGNVKVGILITAINIVGGIIVGMTIHGEPLELALQNYISLTVGDGLVAQFPALLVSTATGLIVTRANLRRYLRKRYVRSVQPAVTGLLDCRGLSDGPRPDPRIPLVCTDPHGSSGRIYRLQTLPQRSQGCGGRRDRRPGGRTSGGPRRSPRWFPWMPYPWNWATVSSLWWIKIRGRKLLDRITRIRREAALELGLVVPPHQDYRQHAAGTFPVLCEDQGCVEVGLGIIRTGHYLAINPGASGGRTSRGADHRSRLRTSCEVDHRGLSGEGGTGRIYRGG